MPFLSDVHRGVVEAGSTLRRAASSPQATARHECRTAHYIPRDAWPALARLSRAALAGVTADFRLQLDNVEKHVGLAAKLVGHHGRLG